MTNKEFDSTLHRAVADETLPFDEGNWEKLEARLNKKGSSKTAILLLPFTVKHWTVAACLLISASAGIWLFSPKKTTEEHFSKLNEKHQTNTPQRTVPLPYENSTPTQSPVVVKQNNTLQPVAKAATYDSVIITTPPQAAIATVKEAPAKTDNNVATTLSLPKKEKNYPPVIFNEYPVPARNGFSISLNGGVTLSAGNGLAGGVTIRNKVSNRVSIETNIGYVQGNQNVPYRNQRITKEPILVISGDTTIQQMGENGEVLYQDKVETWYEQHRHTLPYLQVSPAVNVKLLKKLNSSVGVDVQKILVDKNTLADMNEKLAVASKRIPDVDPGITINLNYSLTKRIGCGVAYRESILSLGSNGNQYINRDYFMVQLQYTIVK